ncbi:hypothetical protein TCAP_02497 [Tolypocladium capitatum]|uniref:Uncharacterized protein n=1 Tax=Tolypocladium capitatum TaxID=45235 RepID=A0A2K3QJ53_9HYPO|nr:hypothetical protein TCAP_02497 [Tolypocladium capitatum]
MESVEPAGHVLTARIRSSYVGIGGKARSSRRLDGHLEDPASRAAPSALVSYLICAAASTCRRVKSDVRASARGPVADAHLPTAWVDGRDEERSCFRQVNSLLHPLCCAPRHASEPLPVACLALASRRPRFRPCPRSSARPGIRKVPAPGEPAAESPRLTTSGLRWAAARSRQSTRARPFAFGTPRHTRHRSRPYREPQAPETGKAVRYPLAGRRARALVASPNTWPSASSPSVSLLVDRSTPPSRRHVVVATFRVGSRRTERKPHDIAGARALSPRPLPSHHYPAPQRPRRCAADDADDISRPGQPRQCLVRQLSTRPRVDPVPARVTSALSPEGAPAVVAGRAVYRFIGAVAKQAAWVARPAFSSGLSTGFAAGQPEPVHEANQAGRAATENPISAV